MLTALRRALLLTVLVALAAGTALAAWRVAVETALADTAHVGLVGPCAAALAQRPSRVVLFAWLAAWGLGLVAALVARAHRESTVERPPPAPTAPAWLAGVCRARPWAVVVGVLVSLGVAWRAQGAARVLWDIDEPWAFPTSGSVLDDSHDALVHPPLYRALAHGWGALSGWTFDAPRWLIRLPSCVAGTLALALLAWLALARPSLRALAALSFVCVAGAPVAASVLARPYGVATLLVTLVAVLVFDAGARRFTPLEAALCVLATSLAAWTDLVAGLAALLLLAARLVLDAPAAHRRETAVFALCAGLPSLPLLPGALLAWRTGIDPASSTIPGVLPDLRPTVALSYAMRVYELLAELSAPLPPWLGLFGLCALLAVAWRRGARTPAAALALLAALPLTLLPFIALRARHFAWLPLIAVAVLVTMPSALPKRAT